MPMQTKSERLAEVRQMIKSKAPAGIERRQFALSQVEVRASGDDGDEFVIEGYAAVFDSLSEDLGGWREKIKRGAFRKRLNDDVRLLVNHDPNLLLARTTNQTLTLNEDQTGLRIHAEVAPTQAGRDLRVLIERGDLTQMSFAFIVGEAEWDETDDGTLVRTITQFAQIYDVAPVTYASYPETSVESVSAEPGDKPEAAEAREGQENTPDDESGTTPESEQDAEASAEERSDEADRDQQVDDNAAGELAEGLAPHARRLRLAKAKSLL